MTRQRKTTTMSSREFNQNTGGAKRAARTGPVIITDRGKPAYVLMTEADYRALSRPAPVGLDAYSALVPGEDLSDIDLDAVLPKRVVEPMRNPFADDEP